MYEVPHALLAKALHILCVYMYTYRAITGPYFVEVFGLPDHPMLADVNAVLKHSSGEKYVQCYKYILCLTTTYIWVCFM